MSEEFGTLVAAASNQLRLRRNHLERLDVCNKGCGRETATMDVGSHGAADGMAIGACWLLADAPPTGLAVRARLSLAIAIASNDIRPRDTALDLEKSALLIQSAHAIQAARVQQRAAAEELLSPHGVPATGNRQRGAIVPCSLDRLDDILRRPRFDDSGDAGAV